MSSSNGGEVLVRNGEEEVGMARARVLLARLKHTTLERVWRTVLEGALLEARSGQIATARRVLKYLMKWVPWYGPIYNEALRLEERAERPLAALQVRNTNMSLDTLKTRSQQNVR